MKTIKLDSHKGLPVYHMNTLQKDGTFETRFTCTENPEVGDELSMPMANNLIIQEIIETRPSTQYYGQGVMGNFYKVKAILK